MLLTKPAILRAYREGRIRIDPFDASCVNSTSVDVRLAEWFYRQQQSPVGSQLINPWSEVSVRSKWEAQATRAPMVGQLITGHERLHRDDFAPFGSDQRVIVLRPGERILAHTVEKIGGADNKIVAKMYARSTLGRNGISVCTDAGWGDIGYNLHWTMEIMNLNPHHGVLLPCGFRVAQMVFLEGEEVDVLDRYEVLGKYQQEANQLAWNPEMMLPRAWKDREIRRTEEETS